jgi:hypothetical protein
VEPIGFAVERSETFRAKRGPVTAARGWRQDVLSFGTHQLGVKNLEGDPAVVLKVFGPEYSRHTTTTDLALDRVAVGHCSRETFLEVGHERLRGTEGICSI